MSFREDFIAWRRSSGYTQEEAARKLGVRVGTISKWERGIHEPDSDRVVGALWEIGIEYERPVIDRLDERMRRAESRIDEIMQRLRVAERDIAEAGLSSALLLSAGRSVEEAEEAAREAEALSAQIPAEDDPEHDEDEPQPGQSG